MTDPDFDVAAELADIATGLHKLRNEIVAFQAEHGEAETAAMLLETLALIPSAECRQVLLDMVQSLPMDAQQPRSLTRLP